MNLDKGGKGALTVTKGDEKVLNSALKPSRLSASKLELELDKPTPSSSKALSQDSNSSVQYL